MNRITSTLMGVALVALVAGSGMAADASVSLDVASAYVFRGATFNDGLVAQPGLEVAAGDFTLGVWGNFDIDDMDGALANSEFSEIDLYGSYAVPIDVVDLSIGYTEFAYPGGGEADREVGLGIGLDCVLAPSLGLYYGLDGAIESSFYAELGVAHDIECTDDLGVSLSAAVGYMAPDEGDSGFSHYQATIGVGYSLLSASVTYVGQIDDDVLGEAYDVELYGMVGIAADL